MQPAGVRMVRSLHTGKVPGQEGKLLRVTLKPPAGDQTAVKPVTPGSPSEPLRIPSWWSASTPVAACVASAPAAAAVGAPTTTAKPGAAGASGARQAGPNGSGTTSAISAISTWLGLGLG
eukprot:scaffold15507_cov49-Phaeocystis_antarctica.AAC.2